ncbi:MAG: glycoside hydrolase family 3 N-terminal domain-containing protein [Proteiniphilum sp.]|jgi:beta-glucosidase|nr:glycoside hydrolase family 3 N-terminal domain-containing protein [Proteiniphilum sp.]NCB24070.1 beta-glucosidase [Bacteroidia bacterium]MDD2937143.1 glycoside hydrolase family 3 N-terminal domain-containing protein [Proteiniphilum sp.]MDD3076045.1 glycoside hydrolase family 3 N-terminal domain-containing protein [Proteiniphilum sp.]MDD3780602.1 glycoside hydrolase family 3 N-terminal domain-containing protein [Proteiniphilum sp.]
MHKIVYILFPIVIFSHLSAQPLYKNPQASVEARVQDLLSRMTTQEKVGQLCSPTGWEMYEKQGKEVVVSDAFVKLMQDVQPGTFWATLRADPWTRKTIQTGLDPELSAKALNALQQYALEKTRLGIPIFFAEECAHGHMAIGTTVFPTSLAQASTFNKDLIFRMGEAIALETRLQGAHIGYGPIIDVARDPRWSRMEETFGEDPVLTGILGSSFVKGLQGSQMGDGRHVYSTLKHFVAYGIPVGGHNGQQAMIGMRELFSNHLSPFRMAVDAGAKTIMTAYNAIDGIPCTANRYLLTDILRGKWQFDGFVFSDLGSVEGIATSHRTVPDIKHAAVAALKAGVETDLGGNAYDRNLELALQEGLITSADLDTAVARVLRLKFEMGLFESPYVDSSKVSALVRSNHHRALAREVAKEGTVLLKNEHNLLPLSKEIKSIAVIGPNADNLYNQLGDYTAPQERTEIATILDGIKRTVSPSTTVRYVKGCAIRDTTQSNIAEAVVAAQNAEVTVLVLGGSSARDFRTEYIETGAAVVSDDKEELISDMESGEGYDRKTLELLGDQEKLLKAIIETGKPLIVIYIQGRPLNMNLASEKADALLCAWYPGQEGGHAVADIIFGNYNPAGRLPVSVPRSVGQLPVYYSLGRQNKYVEGESTPLYAFGYGLSYTFFEYTDLSISQVGEVTHISCVIKNSGNYDGEEVVQLYVQDNISSVATPPIQLKDFERVFLKKGESRKISFILKPHQLSLFNLQMEEETEPGEFTAMMGAASNDIRLRGTFVIK